MAIPGKVDAKAGTITLPVPRALIKGLSGPEGPGQRPKQVPATTGTRVYDASAWTFSIVLPVNQVQSFLSQTDNTAAFDFIIGASASATGPSGPVALPVGVTPPSTGGVGGGTLAATGGLGAPLLALALIGGAAAVLRRRRVT